MFIFGNETELTNYIIKNKDSISQLKNKITIDGEMKYGRYRDKDYKYHYKFSDLVMSDNKTTSIIEVRCKYITPELVRRSSEAIRDVYSHKNIEIIFIGTKISEKLKSKIESSKNMKYIILRNVKYIKDYNKDKKKIKKVKFKPDIEIKALHYINQELKIEPGSSSSFFLNDERTELKLNLTFNNGYGLNINIFSICDKSYHKYSRRHWYEYKYRFKYEYEIIGVDSNNNQKVLISSRNCKFRWRDSQIRNIYYFLHHIPSGYLDNKDIKDIINIISYASEYR